MLRIALSGRLVGKGLLPYIVAHRNTNKIFFLASFGKVLVLKNPKISGTDILYIFFIAGLSL